VCWSHWKETKTRYERKRRDLKLKNLQVRSTNALLFALVLTLYTEVSHAHEYEAYARSATGTGRAYAGEVSKSEDATSVYSNPAAMARVDENRISTVLHVLDFGADYTVDSSTTGNNIGSSTDVEGRRRDSGEKLSYGIGLNTPYAYGVEYESDWAGRYHGTSSELTVFSLTSSASYRLSDSLSCITAN